MNRCFQQIKSVKLPYDSLEGFPLVNQDDGMVYDVNDEFEGGYYDESREVDLMKNMMINK